MRAKPKKPRHFKTDLGNAHQLVARHGKDLRYCHPWRKWLAWDGARWKRDETGEIERRAKETVTAMLLSAARGPDTDARDRAKKHAIQSQSAGRIRAMISLADTEPGIPVTPDQLDCHPYLLNCLNGTLDLRTGVLREHRREDLITKLAPIEYDPKAECPNFEKFLGRIAGDDADLIAFIRRSFGYALTGAVTEKAIFVLYGKGDNGKTTLLEAIRHVLGDYAGQIPIESLMAKQNNGVPNDIAQLKGLRFVTSSEAEQGRRLAEAKVKELTGMGMVQARYLYGEFFHFDPTHKLFIDSNYKPEIRGTDNAIWNRLRLIPFNVSIPDHEKDRKLLEKLKAESAGILAWAVQGCLEWQQNGLGEPSLVRQATIAYRDEMDSVVQFIEEECRRGSGLEEPSEMLHGAYLLWCDACGEEALGTKAFGTRLGELGFERSKLAGSRSWKGIGLRREEGKAA